MAESHSSFFKNIMWLSILLLIWIDAFVAAEDGRRHVRFEYKLSFKGPHLTTKQGNVPFWKHFGSAIPGDEQIRLTPSLKDQKGALWSKSKNTNEFWEVEVFFRVTGRGRVGGDGLAVWYTEEPGTLGPVFGGSDNWKGMGLFFDSFDNDGEQNNPYVMVMLNDGSKQYNHFGDGVDQQLGGCMRDFRNRPHAVRAKIRYYNNVLTVFYQNGMSNKDDDYELCMRAENVQLPKEGFFGVTAATGGLADDHDVIKFLTYSLKQPAVKQEEADKDNKDKKAISEDERKKLTEQYDQYAQKLEKDKEAYQSAHPEKFKRPDEKYETVYDRDVRLIYEGQGAIHQLIGSLHTKTGELTSQINQLHTAVGKRQSEGGGNEAISRQEINTLINMQSEMNKLLLNLRTSFDSVQLPGGGGGGGSEKIDEMHRNVRSVLENVGHIVAKNQFAGGQGQAKKMDCPKINCIGPGYFVFFIIVQVVIIVGYMFYKSQQEQAAKKFY